MTQCTAALPRASLLQRKVCKLDVQPLRQQPAPERAHLLALGDAVGGDEGGAGFTPSPLAGEGWRGLRGELPLLGFTPSPLAGEG